MAKAALFPEEQDTSTDPLSGLVQLSTKSQISSASSTIPMSAVIGDIFHDLSDRQLQKLIAVKFENDPTLLIRQLSRDLAAKEAELILLRQKSSQREHELVRLCTEFGNLSSSEVDQRLSSLKPNNNLQRVVSDMIGSAVNEPQVRECINVNKLNGTTHPKKNFRRGKVRESKSTEARYRSADKEQHSTTGTKQTNNTCTSDEKSSVEQAPHEYVSSSRGSAVPNVNSTSFSAQNQRNSQWLDWLTSPSAGSETSGYRGDHSSSKYDPVELNKFTQPGDEEASISTGTDTDRFGFYKNYNPSTQRVSSSEGRDLIASPEPTKSLDSPKSSTSSSSYVSLTDEKVDVRPTSVQVSTDPHFHKRFSQSVEKLKQLGQQHDDKAQEHLAKWDNFMTNVQRSHSKKQNLAENHESFGFKATYLRKPESHFSWFVAGPESERSVASRSYRELLTLINRRGIPTRYRNRLWLELSGSLNRGVPGEFQRFLRVAQESSEQDIKSNIEQVDLDLHRTLSSNKYFFNLEDSKPGPHYCKLQNILYAFIAYKPHVGYSQGMNRLLANLILGTSEGSAQGSMSLSEEDVFWIFVGLVEELLPSFGGFSFYHPQAVPLIHREVSITVDYYLKVIVPDLHAHLTNLQVETEIIVLGWWLGLFTEALNSLDLWFLVVDGLMLAEDPSVKLITYSITILKLYKRNLMALISSDDVYSFMHKLKNGTVANVRLDDFAATCSSIEKQVSSSKLFDIKDSGNIVVN